MKEKQPRKRKILSYLKDKFFPPLPTPQPEPRFYISKGDSFQGITEAVNKEFNLPPGSANLVEKELKAFISTMQNHESVEALVFLDSHGHKYNALVIEIFASLEKNSENPASLVDAIKIAKRNLAQQLRSALQSEIRLTNTKIGNLNEADSRLHEKWSKDPSIKPLAFVTFNRNQS